MRRALFALALLLAAAVVAGQLTVQTQAKAPPRPAPPGSEVSDLLRDAAQLEETVSSQLQKRGQSRARAVKEAPRFAEQVPGTINNPLPQSALDSTLPVEPRYRRSAQQEREHALKKEAVRREIEAAAERARKRLKPGTAEERAAKEAERQKVKKQEQRTQ